MNVAQAPLVTQTPHVQTLMDRMIVLVIVDTKEMVLHVLVGQGHLSTCKSR